MKTKIEAVAEPELETGKEKDRAETKTETETETEEETEAKTEVDTVGNRGSYKQRQRISDKGKDICPSKN